MALISRTVTRGAILAVGYRVRSQRGTQFRRPIGTEELEHAPGDGMARERLYYSTRAQRA